MMTPLIKIKSSILMLLCLVVIGASAGFSAAQPIRGALLAYSPDGRYLAVLTDDQLQILDAEIGLPLSTVTGLSLSHVKPTWRPDSTSVAIVNGMTLEIWQQPERGDAVQLSHWNIGGWPSAIAWHPIDQNLFAIAGGSTALIVDLTTQTFIHTLEHEGTISAIAWSHDGQYLATAGRNINAEVRVWGRVTGQLSRTIIPTAPNAPDARTAVHDIVWSPDDRFLAIAAADGAAVADLTSPSLLRFGLVFEHHTDRLWALDWNVLNNTIATASQDGTVRLWNAFTAAEITAIQVGHPVYSVAFSPDGTQLAYGGANGTVEIVPAPNVASDADAD